VLDLLALDVLGQRLVDGDALPRRDPFGSQAVIALEVGTYAVQPASRDSSTTPPARACSASRRSSSMSTAGWAAA
jgi:hypothetical protein